MEGCGYTHYIRIRSRKGELDTRKFAKAINDFKKLIPQMERLGVKLAGEDGTGAPLLTNDMIKFNGARDCEHEKGSLGNDSCWSVIHPSLDAKGIATSLNQVKTKIIDCFIFVDKRVCGGNCSAEPFSIHRILSNDLKMRKIYNDEYFTFVETGYKPYDFAVNVMCIILTHYFPNIKVKSDGNQEHWQDAIDFVENYLGYGKEFQLKIDDVP
jgi:hypothetical protein